MEYRIVRPIVHRKWYGGLSPCPSYGALQVRFYMHFPPGSNNRLNDAGENVANNTRLSDSQVGRPYPTLNLLAQA